MTKQIVLRVPESTKKKWDTWANEMGFSNRSEMIRQSVRYYYNDQADDEHDTENEQVLNQLTEIREEMERVNIQLQNVQTNQVDMDDLKEAQDYGIQILVHRFTRLLEEKLFELGTELFRAIKNTDKEKFEIERESDVVQPLTEQEFDYDFDYEPIEYPDSDEGEEEVDE